MEKPFLRTVGTLVLALSLLSPVSNGWTASHREAPLIALDPAADITDVYAFRSWANPGKVVFIMNVNPGEDPSDGPNYFNFDDNVLYRIHIDNNQDGVAEDVVYEFRFTTQTRPVLVGNEKLNFPLAYLGNPHIPDNVPLQGITALKGPGSEGLYRRQTYKVTEVRNGVRTPLFTDQTLVAVPSNVGPATMGRTIPDYEALAAQGIYTDNSADIRVFAGQRAETFYIDLGAVFDTLNLRRFPPTLTPEQDASKDTNPFGVNRFTGTNVHSIAIEVPIRLITVDGEPPADTTTPVIGMYASTSRRQTTTYRAGELPTYDGRFVQVARMANPLVNELIIDTPDKDRWNTSEPEDEADFQESYKTPSVAAALNLIFGFDVVPTPRTDLMTVLLKYPDQPLTGQNCGTPCAELLRLDLRVPPMQPAQQNRLGAALSSDKAGWPNGRRPNDDVTDIVVRVAGGDLFINAHAGDGVNYLQGAPGAGTSDGPGYGTIPGNRLDVTANGITKEFPFLPTPYDGRNRRHIDCGERGANPCNQP
jgi:Domain of unknown function (DUF4331)